MKKQFLSTLLFLVLCGARCLASEPATLLANLIGKVQDNPSDTAAWSSLRAWFDSTTLAPELLGKQLDYALGQIPAGQNDRLRAELLRQNGIASMDRGAYQHSTGYLMRAIRLFESMNDARGIAQVQVNLGALNYHLNQLREAIRYWQQAARYFEQYGPPKRLGLVYSNIGSAFSETDRLDSAAIYHRRALHILEQANDLKGMAQAWNNLGVTNEYGDHFAEALSCYRKAEVLCRSAHDQEGEVRAKLNQSTILAYQHKYAEALQANQQAVDLLARCRVKTLYRLAYVGQADIYSAMGRYKQAYESLDRYQVYKDSIVNEENTRYIQRLQVSYETEKKEKEIALLNKEGESQALRLERQRLLTAALLVIALLLGVLARIVFRHQKRSMELLHNILPVSVASELRHTGQVLPKRHEMVTVLFADLVGFTEFGHSLPPEILIGLIDRYYRAFDEIVARHGVEKIKTIGDSYMCAGGLPDPDPEHARRVFRVAVDMLEWVDRNTVQFADIPMLQLRIGMHSGPVVAGVAGKCKYAYDIWGNTVNIAARMEQFGVPGRINLSEATRELLGNEVRLEARAMKDVKGIGKVRMYLAEEKGRNVKVKM